MLETILTLYDEAVAARPGIGTDPLGSYTRLLWLTARYLLTAYSRQEIEEVCPDFDAWCDKIKEIARTDELSGLRGDITEIEVDLIQLIRQRERLEAKAEAQGMVEDLVEQQKRRLGARLDAVLQRGLSARQRTGVENNFSMLDTLLSGATVKPRERAEDAAIAAWMLARMRQR